VIKAKIIHIITMLELGGAQQNTLYTVQSLNPKKFEAFLVAGQGGELFAEARTLKNMCVAPQLVREIRPWQDLRALVQIMRIIHGISKAAPASAPIIVHTHSSKAGILGRWAAKLCGVPVIVHSIHGFGFHDALPWFVKQFYIMVERLSAAATTKFIAVSQANIDKGARLQILRPEQAVLIRSGIDTSSFMNPGVSRSQARIRLGIEEQAPVVTMIACLKHQKAPLDYVRACSLVKSRVPDAHFFLAGDGILRPAVEAAIVAHNLQGSFHLLGWFRDIPALLQATDVALLTSRWEGLPRVLPQAMAAGLPVVATRVDGSPEAIRNGVNGYLVEPGDIQAMAERTTSLLHNKEKASAMGRQGRLLVAEFDCHRMVADQERLYEQLLSTAGGGNQDSS